MIEKNRAVSRRGFLRLAAAAGGMAALAACAAPAAPPPAAWRASARAPPRWSAAALAQERRSARPPARSPPHAPQPSVLSGRVEHPNGVRPQPAASLLARWPAPAEACRLRRACSVLSEPVFADRCRPTAGPRVFPMGETKKIAIIYWKNEKENFDEMVCFLVNY